MELQGFLAGSKKFVSGNLFELASQTEAHGGGLGDRLGTLSSELDDLMKSGSRAMDEVDGRVEYIGSLIEQRNDPKALELLPDFPDQIRHENGNRVDPVENVLHTMRGRQGSPFDAYLDDALDGVALVDKTQIDSVIPILRDSSSYWSSGLIDRQAQQIESLLKGTKPVSADAAVLLGQPIVTARIPMSIGKKGGVAYSDVHLVTDGIVGSAVGFGSIDTMRKAAAEYIGQNPGRVMIGVSDSETGYHLLTASAETSPRSLLAPSKLGRSAKETMVPVELKANHPKVAMIMGSDKKVTFAEDMGFSADEFLFPVQPWPDGYTPPLSAGALENAGGVKRHVSVQRVLDEELDIASANRSAVEQRFEELANVRKELRDKRIEVSEIGEVVDRAGTGSPTDWEVGDLLYHPLFGSKYRAEFVPEFDGLAKSLPGYSVADAVHHASSIKLKRPGLVTVVMQDPSGTPHLLATGDPAGVTLSSLDVHPDLRAIVNSSSGRISLLRPEPGAPGGVLREVGGSRSPLDASTIFSKHFDGKSASLDSDWEGKFAPFADDEPIRIVESDDYRDAAVDIASQIKSWPQDQATVLLVALPEGRKKTFGLVRIKEANAGWTSAEKYDWQQKTAWNVMAAIDKDGIQFMRS